MTDLEKAAQAVLVRWDSPAWDWAHQGPTAALMADLRDALAAHREQAEPVESSAGAGGAGGWGEPVVWVGVTEVEVSDIYTRRAIEAVLKQKNAQQQAEPVVDPSVESMLQAGRFCDANCTALDHHADCVIGNPSF